jgi:DNA-binding CsgD family transcriptional regulator
MVKPVDMSCEGNPVLTAREREVTAFVVRGYGDRKIAAELGISAHTVGRHLRNIFEKLNIHNRCSLVLYAARERMVDLHCEAKLEERLTRLACLWYASEALQRGGVSQAYSWPSAVMGSRREERRAGR